MPKKKSSALTKFAPTEPSSIEALARRFAAPDSSLEREWNDEAAKACMAAVTSALRQRSATKLEAALEMFGGLPPQGAQWNAAQPLWEAARDPGAFGFEKLLEIQQAERAGKSKYFELGKWLRHGFHNDAWIERPLEPFCTSAMAMPAGACMGTDNPVALAKILKDPVRFEALRAMEPEPNPELPGIEGVENGHKIYDEKARTLLSEARLSGSVFETSLLWHAMACGAHRCAALLAAIPEFNMTAMVPRGFASGNENGFWTSRSAQSVFEEAKNGKVEFSLFEWAVQAHRKASEGDYAHRDEREAAWRSMVESMVDSAPPEARAWRQQGTGMGWPEILWSRLEPHKWGGRCARGNDQEQIEIAKFTSLLSKMENKGFEVPWGQFAKICESCSILQEWCTLREVTLGIPKPDPSRNRVLSL